jgi:hypothetical protein
MKENVQTLMKLESIQNLNIDLKAEIIKSTVNVSCNQYMNKDKEDDLTNKYCLNRSLF